jgi:hypothetical protein
VSVTRVSGQAQRISFDQETTVYNPSTSVSLLIGNVVPDTRIGPQGAFIMEGGKQYWIASQDGSVQDVDLLSGLTGAIASPGDVIASLITSTLPSLIATAVQTAGVPAIDNPAATFVTINSDVPAGGVFNSGHITMAKYQSYTMVLHADNVHNNVDTIPYMRVTLKWSLQADNFDPVHVEDWVIPVTPFSFTFNYHNYGAGPCYSDTLDIVVTSYDTVINTVTIGVFGSFRQRLRSILRGQYNWLGGGGVNEPAGLGSDAMLAMISATNLAAGASSPPQLVNLWHGNTALYVEASDTAIDDVEIHIQPQPNGVLVNQPDIILTMDGGGPFTRLTDILLPRRVCTMFFVNAGAIAIPSIQASLVMDGVSE